MKFSTELDLQLHIEQEIRSLPFPNANGEELIAFFWGRLPYDKLSFHVKEQFKDYPFQAFGYSFLLDDDRHNKILYPVEWPIVHRIYTFLLLGEQSYHDYIFFSYQMNDRTNKEHLELYELLLNTVPLSVLVSFLVGRMSSLLTYGSEYRDSVFYKASKAWMNELISSRLDMVLNQLKDMSPKGRSFMLEQLASEDFLPHKMLFIEHMGDSSKTVRDSMIALLAGHPELFDEIKNGLQAKKKAIRESTIRIIGQWQGDVEREVLRDAYKSEPMEALKAIIAEYLPAEQTAAFYDYASYEAFAKKKQPSIKMTMIDWVPWEKIHKVRADNSDTIVPIEMIQYWVHGYALLSKMTVCHEGRMIGQFLNKSDLQAFSMELLQLWIELGAESKKKWVLALATTHGGEAAIYLLKRKLADWPADGRGAIACEAVRALAISGQDSGLMLVDNMARSFKYRQVKEAAAAAFDAAADELGVEREVLADRIVLSLGFSQRGEQVIDFGVRTFTLKISSQMQLEIFDASNKKLKSLPKPTGEDDVEKVGIAAGYVKQLKKSLKTVITTQASRIEYALASGRKWSNEMWTKLFVDNPLLQNFAIGMIWGSYQGEELVATFRYLEDGTLNTYDEQPFEVLPEHLIGLVHPMELSGEEISLWLAQLEDYEISQPITQLKRTIHRMTEMEMSKPVIQRFRGRVIHPLSLKGKMTKYAWSRGSVGDGGMYHCFYKEDPRSGIGIQLNFSGAFVGDEGGFEEEVVIREVFFFKNGSSARGDDYAENRDAGLMEGSAIPPRIFSEAIYELELITASFTEVIDENE